MLIEQYRLPSQSIIDTLSATRLTHYSRSTDHWPLLTQYHMQAHCVYAMWLKSKTERRNSQLATWHAHVFLAALGAAANVGNHNPRTTHWGAFKLISYWISECFRLCVWGWELCLCLCHQYNRRMAGNTFAVCLGTHAGKFKSSRFLGRRNYNEFVVHTSIYIPRCVTLCPSPPKKYKKTDTMCHAHSISGRFDLVPRR